jgi:hypothetical protein
MSLRDSCQAQTTTFRHRRHNMTRFQRWKRQGLTRRDRYHQTANQRTRRICWRGTIHSTCEPQRNRCVPFQFHRIRHIWFVDGPKSQMRLCEVSGQFVTCLVVYLAIQPFRLLFPLQSIFWFRNPRFPIASPLVHHHVPHFLSTTFITTVHLSFTRISTKTYFQKTEAN